MSVLAANLKHLYQRPGMWLMHLAAVFFVIVSVAAAFDGSEAGEGHFVRLVACGFLFGLLIAVSVMDVLVRPFSFCLPGHRRVVRVQLFVFGIAANAAASLLFLAYPGLTAVETVVVACSAFFAGLIPYWMGVMFAFGTKNTGGLIGLVVLAAFLGELIELPQAVERAIVHYPHWVILVSAFASAGMWVWLGNPGLARRHCCKDWIGFFDAFNLRKVMKQTRVRRAEQFDKAMKGQGTRVEEMFLGRMRGYGFGSRGRCVWGGLYASFAPVLLMWRRAIPGIVLLTLFFGYVGPASWFMMVVMPLFMLINLRLPMYSNMLICGGRRERYTSTLAAMVTSIVGCTVLIAVMAVISKAFSLVLPEMEVMGHTVRYTVLDPAFICAAAVLYPFGFVIGLLFYRRPVMMWIVTMVVGQGVFFAVMITTLVLKKDPAVLINPYLIVALTVLGWSGLFAALGRVSGRRDLVWN